MSMLCPHCRAKTTELVDCENCGKIGCPKCVRRKNKKWVCPDCKNYQEPINHDSNKLGDVFSSMFG